MKNILLISGATFKGIAKDKVFYGIILCAVLCFLGIYMISSLSLGNDIKVMRDLGLGSIFLFSSLITIFFGATKMRQELREKTHLQILSRPVNTLGFLIGKFIGLFVASAVACLIMQGLYLSMLLFGRTTDFLSLFQLVLLLGELAIVLSLALLFSIIMNDVSTIILTITIFYIGHSLVFLKNAFQNANLFSQYLVNSLYYILPNLEKFNIRNSIVAKQVPSSGQIIYPLLYSILFTIILLWLSNIALKKERD